MAPDLNPSYYMGLLGIGVITILRMWLSDECYNLLRIQIETLFCGHNFRQLSILFRGRGQGLGFGFRIYVWAVSQFSLNPIDPKP